MKAELIPVYEDIFVGEEKPNLRSILLTTPSEVFIKACCYINGKLYNATDTFEEEKNIFLLLIGRIEDDVRRNKYFNNLKKFIEITKDGERGIFPLPHTLRLIELSFLANTPGKFQGISVEQELNILKALLILNSEANTKFGNSFSSIDLSRIDSHYRIFWTNLLLNSTLLLKKDVILSMYKALKFLAFLEKNYQDSMNEYIIENKVDKYQRIPIKVFEFITNGYNNNLNSFGSSFSGDFYLNNTVLEVFTIDAVEYSREEFVKQGYDKNYKGLRTFPILKFSKDEIVVSNWNMIVEKFYEGLVFDFFRKTSIQKKFNLPDFKNKVGDGFTQQFFTDTMKEIFSGPKIISLKEKERNDTCDYDYYIRIRNQVFIFEFKDILFPIKETYEEIKEVLDKKLSEKKGINQLIRHIENFIATPDVYDDLNKDNYTIKDVFIYPIIVYTDSSFGLNGVNHYLNGIFQSKLKNKLPPEISVRPLVMVPLEFFLRHYDDFKTNKLDLVDVLHSYYQLMQLRIDIHKRNRGDMVAFHEAYDGFMSVMGDKLKYHPKDILNSSIYKYVLEELKPHLPG